MTPATVYRCSLMVTALLIAGLIPMATCESSEQFHVTCNITSVPLGHTAKLICDFGSDMRLVRTNITVQRGVLETKDLLRCHWSPEKNYQCSSTGLVDKIGFATGITRYLTLYVPDADESDHQQTYVCIRAGTDHLPNPCTFNLRDGHEDADGSANQAWRTGPSVPLALTTSMLTALSVSIL